MNKSIAVFLALLCVNYKLLAAQAPVPVPVPVFEIANAKGGFIQVPLNHEVYKYDWQNDFRDMAVIDAEQNPLPYKIVPTPAQAQPGDVTHESLAFFPVASDVSPDSLRKLHRESVQYRDGATETLTSEKFLTNATPDFYLVDVSGVAQAIDAILIDWTIQTGNDYLEVELEASQNLRDWTSIARATLVQINQQGQTLKRNRVPLDVCPKQYEFIRLRVLRGGDHLKITQVVAEHQTNAQISSPVRETWKVPGQTAKAQVSQYSPNKNPVAAWEFARNESTPIDSIRIDFGHYPYADTATIFSRADNNQPWKLQQRGIWFNAQVGENWLASEAAFVQPNRDKFWRIELTETARQKANPQLVFGWIPTELQIIANAKPPFSLAIDKENNSAYYRGQVFDQIMAATKPVWASAELKSLDVHLPTQSKPVNWREWIFWLLLLASVVVLGLFAFRLLRQLK